LHAQRELLNIPVLGPCEASVFVACMMGACFSVVLILAHADRASGDAMAEAFRRAGLAGNTDLRKFLDTSVFYLRLTVR
jgi:Asp/Glu/hydantoin racemase